MSDSEDRVQGEESIIQQFLRPLAATWPGAFDLRDDCAAIEPAPGHELIIKTDPIRAGVHFFADDDPRDIAWKAVAVNVSDLAAKAARPLAYTLALSFPQAPARRWLQDFATGLAEAQAALGCVLIGGDTDRAEGPLSMAVTVFGEMPAGRMIRRATARPRDRLFVSGTLGDAALGLRLQQGGVAAAPGLNRQQQAAVRARYLRPQPRLGLRAALRLAATAAMDLSDGLAKDLGRMCRAGGVGAEVRLADIPISEAVRHATHGGAIDVRSLISSGDDYEILCAVPQPRCDDFIASARVGGIAVTEIGRVTSGGEATLCDPGGDAIDWLATGYDHF
jgi:thiamine-monophosphate kinase